VTFEDLMEVSFTVARACTAAAAAADLASAAALLVARRASAPAKRPKKLQNYTKVP
jgi:hypothetical protein